MKDEEKHLLPLYKKISRTLKILCIVIALALFGIAVILYGGKIIVDEHSLILDATTTIETTEGKVVGELFHEKRTPVSINYIPDHVKNAFIAIEDRRFYKHSGVDFKSIIRAIYRDIIALSKVEGASTITQQLAKNLFLHNDKTWMRKTKEVMAAIHLEREYSKDEILQLYLNKIYFGHGFYGVEAAAQKFFSKSINEVTMAEGALIAGLAKAPNGYSPIEHPEKSLNRRDLVLKSMNETEVISAEKLLQEQGKTLGLDVYVKEPNPWVDSYLDLVMKEAAKKHKLSLDELKRGGYRIIINMNEFAQKVSYSEFMMDDYFPGNTEGVEGAFVMMDQENGKVIAVIGGRDYQIGDLNRATVKRQPGSVIKPIAVYGPAMMGENYEPYTLIPDEPLGYDDYVASNTDHQYDGSVSIYNAIVESKNAPAVWLLDQIGIDYTKNYLAKMDIEIPDEGLAIALGGLSEGITPLKMAESYQAFINNGSIIEHTTIEQIYDQNNELISSPNINNTEVFSPQVAWYMTEILQSTVKDGTAQEGEYAKDLAGKTGSTGHPLVKGKYKDAWFVGYTPQYVSALWMGYDRSDEEHYLTAGSSYPTKLTKKILTEIDKKEPLTAKFTKPENVEPIPQPIVLPHISEVNATYIFGGFSLIKGKLTWSGSDDKRVIYRVYQAGSEEEVLIGEVSDGEDEFVIDKVSLFQPSSYYVVPYDPLTNAEGDRSDSVELSW